VIDGHQWEAGDARGISCKDAAFEDQSVRLSPATDDQRTRMIRSNRWSPEGKARVAVSDVPAGTYSVYMYVWEDNDAQTFDIHLNGKIVAKGVSSGPAGHWQRLGPWVIDVGDGTLELAAVGGIANLSGLEIWRGKLSDKDNPISAGDQPRPPSAEANIAALLARNCLECHSGAEPRADST
jgi:hypothetical protein